MARAENRRTFLRNSALVAGIVAGGGCASESGAIAQASFANGEDWPRFLGPRQNGSSLETGILKSWPKEGPPMLWERDVGAGYGAPVTTGGRLIIFHREGDEEIIACVDATDPQVMHWRAAYPTSYRDSYGYNNGPRSSPAVVDGKVYTYGAEGMLARIDLETGAFDWRRPVKEEYKAPQGFFGAGVAPLVDGGMIYINLGAPEGKGVAAFDAATGETVWTASEDEASYSTPIAATVNGERLIIFHTGDGLLVAEAKTGKVRYTYPFRSEIYESAIAASPVIVDDVVFLSATYEVGSVALRLGADGLEEIWRDQDAMQNHWATSVYHDGYLYGMDGRHEMGSNLRCIEFATGKVAWTADKGLGRASFIMVDGYLLAIGEWGELALIDVSTEGYTEHARARIMRRPVWTPPVLSHGLLYLRNERTMHCFDMRGMA